MPAAIVGQPSRGSWRRSAREVPVDVVHQGLEPRQLAEGHVPSVGRELVVAAPLALGTGPPVRGLDDQTVVHQAVQRPVERAGSHPDRAVALLLHPPHQRVAVRRSGGQGQDDVLRRGRERLG